MHGSNRRARKSRRCIGNAGNAAAQGLHLLDIPIGPSTLVEILDDVELAIATRQSQLRVACANPHSLVKAKREPEFFRALLESTHVIADGIGVTGAAVLAGVNVGPRITGNDFFTALAERLDCVGNCRVFFFGSTPEVLERIRTRFERMYPNVVFAGALAPPFGDWTASENAELIDAIVRAEPDVLLVGMTAPRQEKWVDRNCRELPIPVIASIGAVFDFFAGTYKRAPRWVRNCGIEWVYRLLQEPRRLWRRTFVSGPLFIADVIAWYLKVRVTNRERY